ncbi:MAG: hypothetical protein ACREUZ_22960, partial [Burkholderiales bacterium]
MGEARMQPLHELVLDQVLVNELLRAEDYREIDARIAERTIANEWLELRHSTSNPTHDVYADVHD